MQEFLQERLCVVSEGLARSHPLADPRPKSAVANPDFQKVLVLSIIHLRSMLDRDTTVPQNGLSFYRPFGCHDPLYRGPRVRLPGISFLAGSPRYIIGPGAWMETGISSNVDS